MASEKSSRVVRFTHKKNSVDFSRKWLWLALAWRALSWLLRRCKPLAYHPLALAGLGAQIAASALSWWVLLWLNTATVGMLLNWRLAYPHSYRRHIQWRIDSFLAGFKYRHRPRRKLTTCGLLNDQDPVPTISTVHKEGCITKVRIKMSHGDSLLFWLRDDRPARIAQTYNAQDCKINPYRRETLNPFKHETVTKYRWLELEFLTKDPFSSTIGTEYLNYHNTTNTLTPVISVWQNGNPRTHTLAAHRLRIAMTRWGKSVAIRSTIYAHRHNIKEGLLELWGIDGKGGVEQEFLKHLFARTAYGDSNQNPNAYNPSEFDRLLKDAVKVMKRRLRTMRGETTEHTPTKKQPWLLIVIDELLVLTNPALDPNLRKSIASSIMLIQQQGIAAGVSLDASTQLATMELIPFRKGFTHFELGKSEPGLADMVFGTGWYERGARTDQIPDDLKGSFYEKGESNMAPELHRYPNTTVDDISEKRLGFRVEGSKLMRLQAVTPPQPPLQSQPEPEPEYDPLDDFGVS